VTTPLIERDDDQPPFVRPIGVVRPLNRRGATVGAGNSLAVLDPFVARLADRFGPNRRPLLSYRTLRPLVIRAVVDRTGRSTRESRPRFVRRPLRPGNDDQTTPRNPSSGGVESLPTVSARNVERLVVRRLETVTSRVLRTTAPAVVARESPSSRRGPVSRERIHRRGFEAVAPVDADDQTRGVTAGVAAVTPPTVRAAPTQRFARPLDEPRPTLVRIVRDRPVGPRWVPRTAQRWTETTPNRRVAPERPARVGSRRPSPRSAGLGPTSRDGPRETRADQPTLTVRTTPTTGPEDAAANHASSTPPTAGVGPTTGATNGSATPAMRPTPTLDLSAASRGEVDRLVDRLYDEFARKLRIERERRGR
jgi:hypothetical protein